MQTKTLSLIEAITNTLAGLLIAFSVQLVIYPIMNIPVRIDQNIVITLVFTGVSIIRSYIFRRLFNKLRN